MSKTTTTTTTTTGNTEAKRGTKAWHEAEASRLREQLAATQSRPDGTKGWAYAGVGLMAVMSMYLNGYANAQHATVEWAGWAMGFAVPTIILLVARVAGLKYKAGKLMAAKCGAGVIGMLLLLSVWHCATSIAALTGSHIVLALPMAVAIDCGLVYCEYATLDS